VVGTGAVQAARRREQEPGYPGGLGGARQPHRGAVVDVVGQFGIEVAERVVAQRPEMHHRIRRHLGQLLGRHVPQVGAQRRYRLRRGTQDAVGEQARVQTDHLVAGGGQPGNQHAAEVSLVAGYENTHVQLQLVVTDDYLPRDYARWHGRTDGPGHHLAIQDQPHVHFAQYAPELRTTALTVRARIARSIASDQFST